MEINENKIEFLNIFQPKWQFLVQAHDAGKYYDALSVDS